MQTTQTSKYALFIGRFQPFHLGHLKDIKDILDKHEKIIIAIGSSEKKRTKENPFSIDERKDMIEIALKDTGIKKPSYQIIPITDIGDNNLWVGHVEKIIPHLNHSVTVYTGNTLVEELFKNAGYKVKKLTIYKNITSTTIRHRIERNLDWKELILPAVAYYLDDIDAEKIIKDIEEKRIREEQQKSEDNNKE